MTLVYRRQLNDPAKPRMHALVLGIGRFPDLEYAPHGDRPACADSARAVVEFLVRNEEHFEAKLASIDCLISDPRNAPGADTLNKTHPHHDPRANTLVEPGLKEDIERVCGEWMGRSREGDCLFLYCCSHGLAGLDERGLLVCEDYNSVRHNKPGFLLNVGSMAKSLPAALKAGSVWVFMDACQEVVDELLDLDGGVGGIQPARAGLRDQVNWPVKSTAIVAAQLGHLAYAPVNGGKAYFTETLLHGLEKCCVESFNGQWFVTSRLIENTLSQLSDVLDVQNVSTSRLTDTQPHHRLLPISQPKVPIAIATRPETLMTQADKAEIKPRRPGSDPIEVKVGQDATWRCELPLDERQYEVCLSYDGQDTRQQEFDLDPPSVFVRIE